MNWWDAVVLGIVEGITEYLPVSSTGHLILTQRALGVPETAASNAYAICIQAGAILAVLGLYRRRVGEVTMGWLGKVGIGSGNDDGFRLGLHIIVAFIPAAILGLLFDEWIEEKLFGLWPVVFAWLAGGLAILLVAWRRKNDSSNGKLLNELTWQMALGIGLLQCVAMWPGTSRSLMTIVGGVLVGLRLVAAVEFSFLLGLLTLCAATVYKAKDAGPLMVEEYGWMPMIVGSIAAWVSAIVAVKWMVDYLKKNGMAVFGYYRVLLAAVVAGLLAADLLVP